MVRGLVHSVGILPVQMPAHLRRRHEVDSEVVQLGVPAGAQVSQLLAAFEQQRRRESNGSASSKGGKGGQQRRPIHAVHSMPTVYT
ncbi:hypothetical protein Rhe02_34690 [Rhizocola hellebori]|uniref:Uncharacterized protein n=1 Tax=Rhizocola hellebori TaxID=1392758 RepID=A0A8J3Q8R2_9ACTN|nr:hypothetical protein Rhe02_34690 [Rhizocola hellebori]